MTKELDKLTNPTKPKPRQPKRRKYAQAIRRMKRLIADDSLSPQLSIRATEILLQIYHVDLQEARLIERQTAALEAQ